MSDRDELGALPGGDTLLVHEVASSGDAHIDAAIKTDELVMRSSILKLNDMAGVSVAPSKGERGKRQSILLSIGDKELQLKCKDAVCSLAVQAFAEKEDEEPKKRNSFSGAFAAVSPPRLLSSRGAVDSPDRRPSLLRRTISSIADLAGCLVDLESPSTPKVQVKAGYPPLNPDDCIVAARLESVKQPAAKIAEALHDSRVAEELGLLGEEFSFQIYVNTCEEDYMRHTISKFSFNFPTPKGVQSHDACTLVSIHPPGPNDSYDTPFIISGYAVETALVPPDKKSKVVRSRMLHYGAVVQPIDNDHCSVTIIIEVAPGSIPSGLSSLFGSAPKAPTPSALGHAVAAFLHRLSLAPGL